MNIIDLSHTIHPEMVVFPGTEQPILTPANTMEKDGFREMKITIYSHTGTHLDAPGHMLENGLTLDQYPVEQFMGSAVLLDLSNLQSEVIDINSLVNYKDLIAKADFLILRTDWSKYWGHKQYFQGYPVLSSEAANWLLGFRLKGLGVDTISIDRMDSKSFPIHYLFLGKGLIIIENLTNLAAIRSQSFLFSCLPLKHENADGSPIRAIAIVT